jgi:alkylation response protein AidB-like acyl-CoA dehydrogenase
VNFDLSEEQLMLQDTVKQLMENECPPSRLREIFDGDSGFDPVLWKSMVEMGLAGLPISEQYGGAELELLDLAVVAETLGNQAAPGPFLGHALASLALELGGSDAQKSKWLPRLAAGEAIGTVAFAEEDGWQPADWTLDAGSALSGTKAHVLFAGDADLIVVGVAGGRLALVEKGAAGIEVEVIDGADRTRRLANLKFDGTPCELLEGDSKVSERVRDAALVLLAADAFGGASRLVDMSVEYAKTREQFGVTIGHFQGLKHQLANMAVEVEPARALYWFAAHAFDHEPDESERTAALAKAHITDRYMQVARDSVEAHGGIGFTWECDVQIWFKRAMFDRAFLGAPALHRERAAQLAGW